MRWDELVAKDNKLIKIFVLIWFVFSKKIYIYIEKIYYYFKL